MLEIIHEYITCEIGGDSSANNVPSTAGAGKNYAVSLDGNQADSVHPKVKYTTDATDAIFGKFVSITPDGKQARVAVRGDNMIFAGNSTATTEVADADVGKGLVWDTSPGRVGPGAALGSRDADERGHIIGGTLSSIRVSFP